MTIQQLKDRFKDEFTKVSLKNMSWAYNHQMYTVKNYQLYIDNLDIVNVIFLLNELGYEFKQKDFDTFILALTIGKSTSFLVREHYRVKYDYLIKLMDIFFSKFTPSKKQLDMMINCYIRKVYNANFEWVTTLIEKGITFDSKQQDILIKAGCSPSEFFKDELSVEKLSEILNNNPNINTSSGMEDFKKLLDKCDMTNDTVCVEKVLRYHTYNTIYVYQVVHKMISRGAKATTAAINTMINTFGYQLMKLFNELIDVGAEPR